MTLKSKRFAGDRKLQAAADVDQSHITKGAAGSYVAKIQSALIELDGAIISGEELRHSIYGESTAQAVLAFKRKRNIINRAYQSQPDNIVGKMTIAALDQEMQKKELAPSAATRLEPVTSKRRLDSDRRPVQPQSKLSFNFAFDDIVLTPEPTILSEALDIRLFASATFRVLNGVGGVLTCDPKIVALFDPEQATAPNFVPVTKQSQVFGVRGVSEGSTIITWTRPFATMIALFVTVGKRKEFHQGVHHDHEPTGKWEEIRKDPKNNGFGENNEGGNALGAIIDANILTISCKAHSDPLDVINDSIRAAFGDKPRALDHLRHYLHGGGKDFTEDTNIRQWLENDSGIRLRLRQELANIPNKTGRKIGRFKFEQGGYDNSDFHFSFGAIDILEYEFDFVLDLCTVWFKDRYEWHPVYDGIYVRQDKEEVRETNCLHAALVEMKSRGAKDFWMIGEASVPLSTILRP